jgi:hypothetical protein
MLILLCTRVTKVNLIRMIRANRMHFNIITVAENIPATITK